MVFIINILAVALTAVIAVVAAGAASIKHLTKPSTQTVIYIHRGGKPICDSGCISLSFTKKIRTINIDVSVDEDNNRTVTVTDNGTTSVMSLDEFKQKYRNVLDPNEMQKLSKD